MVKRLISIILSLLMAALSTFIPGLFGDNGLGISTGDWLALVVDEFGMGGTDYSKDPYYASVPADNEYFAVVQIAYEWDVIGDDDKIDVEANVTNAFVAKTLVNAVSADLSGIGLISNKKMAVFTKAYDLLLKAKELWANKEFDAPESDIVPDNGVADLTDAAYLVADEDKLVYAASDFDLAVGQDFIAGVNTQNLSGAAYKVLGVEELDEKSVEVTVEELPLEAAVETIDFEGSFSPNLGAAQVTRTTESGKVELVQSADLDNSLNPTAGENNKIKDLIDKGLDAAKKEIGKFIESPKISFSIKGFKVKASYKDDRVDISIGGNIVDNVYVEKLYSLTNIDVSAKYDANLKKLKINEAYIISNYDLVETTVLQGSYAASVVPGDASEEDSAADFLSKVKNSLSNLKLVEGSGVKVNIFTFTIPLGATGLTIDLDISLSISACGRIEIVVSSNETKGYEIINNKGRVISESTVYDRLYNISGDFKVLLGLELSLTFLKFKIVDVAFQGGIGAYVYTTVFNVTTRTAENFEVPIDIAVEVTSGLDTLASLRFCANVQLYGILKVSVGKNSIIDKIGLSKEWTFYDRSNGVFAELHIENEGIVDACQFVA